MLTIRIIKSNPIVTVQDITTWGSGGNPARNFISLTFKVTDISGNQLAGPTYDGKTVSALSYELPDGLYTATVSYISGSNLIIASLQFLVTYSIEKCLEDLTAKVLSCHCETVKDEEKEALYQLQVLLESIEILSEAGEYDDAYCVFGQAESICKSDLCCETC